MKKILVIATVAAALSGLTASAQGNFTFGTPASYVWNNVSPVIARGGPFNVGFLWSSGVAAPAVASFGANGVPTNNAASGSVQVTPAAWTAILTDPNYALAQNADLGNATVVGTVSSTGAIVYNLGSGFHVTGSSSGGGTANVFMIAWDNAYSTPQAAAAANASLGWSKAFSYAYANSSSAPANSLGQAAATLDANAYKFGVSPIPEPGTFAIAGLGIASMLIARRRK